VLLLRLLATTRRPGLPLLEQLLPQPADAPGTGSVSSGSVAVAIGPEGGWTPEEEQAAEAAGWQPVGLGAAILRTSTAAVSAAALLAAWRRGLAVSCGTSRPPSP
jgi:16S rRNA (uracil1498-N3)-methyltransferase